MSVKCIHVVRSVCPCSVDVYMEALKLFLSYSRNRREVSYHMVSSVLCGEYCNEIHEVIIPQTRDPSKQGKPTNCLKSSALAKVRQGLLDF